MIEGDSKVALQAAQQSMQVKAVVKDDGKIMLKSATQNKATSDDGDMDELWGDIGVGSVLQSAAGKKRSADNAGEDDDGGDDIAEQDGGEDNQEKNPTARANAKKKSKTKRQTLAESGSPNKPSAASASENGSNVSNQVLKLSPGGGGTKGSMKLQKEIALTEKIVLECTQMMRQLFTAATSTSVTGKMLDALLSKAQSRVTTLVSGIHCECIVNCEFCEWCEL